MGDGLDESLFGGAFSFDVIEVECQLFGGASGNQDGHGDQAAITRRELRANPDSAEENIIGVADQCGSKVGQRVLRHGDPFKALPNGVGHSPMTQGLIVVDTCNEWAPPVYAVRQWARPVTSEPPQPSSRSHWNRGRGGSHHPRRFPRVNRITLFP